MQTQKDTLNELALFAGAGGGILGGLLCGFRTICAVEHDPYARDVLVARQNDGCLAPFPIWDDVCTFDGRPWRGRVDVVSGGFPCQDISAAGRGEGITGARSGLWKEMRRIIGEVLPRYVLVENSPVLTSRGLGTVLGDLAALGYHARWGVLGAVHAGAPHKRERIWIVADREKFGRREGRERRLNPGDSRQSEQSLQDVADAMRDGAGKRFGGIGGKAGPTTQFARRRECGQPGDGCEERPLADSDGGVRERRSDQPEREAQRRASAGRCREDVSDPCEHIRDRKEDGARRRKPRAEGIGGQPREAGCERFDWWATEPDVGRVAHGVAARVDRLRCIGNGQVPAVVQVAWPVLAP